MATPYQLLALLALVVFGTYGWGELVVRSLWRARGVPEDLTGPLRITIGLAAFMAVGGFAVASDVARYGALLGWQIAGALLGVVLSVGRVRRWRPAWKSRGAASVVLVVAIGAFLAYLAFGAASNGPYNIYDDDPGYLYLAQRLLSTGGLIDPFNMRRITSYGSAELFQAMTLRVGGNSTGLLIEWFLFPLLLLALVLGRARRPLAPLVLGLLGLGIVLVRPVGVWANVAPTFSGTVLTVATFQLLAPLRRGDGARARFALCGLLLAASLSLRLEFCLVAAVVVVLVALTKLGWSEAWRCITIAGGVFVAGIAGWAVALQRSSGTPLYPFVAGNWNTAFPWNDPAIHTVRQYVDRFVQQLTVNGLGWMLAGSFVLLVALVLLRRVGGRGEGMDSAVLVLGFALAGCLFEVIVETVSLTGANQADIGRYSIPSALACLLYAIDALWHVLAPSRALQTEDAAPVALRRAWAWRAGLGVLAIGAFGVALETTPAGYGALVSLQSSQAAGVLSGSRAFPERWAGLRSSYDELNQLVPKGAYVLAAVDVPAFLDFSRYRFATLDIAGATSPPPHLPLFANASAAIHYLRGLGIEGIVASSTRTPGLFQERPWAADVDSGVYDYHVLGRYFVAWANLLDALERDPAVHFTRVHTLIYLSFGPSRIVARRAHRIVTVGADGDLQSWAARTSVEFGSSDAGGSVPETRSAMVAEEQQRTRKFDWDDLDKLEAAIAWRRELENASLAHVWHLDTLADLAASLRQLLLQQELDERLISLLWSHVPGDDRVDVAGMLEAPGNRFPGGSERLGGIAGRST